MKRMRIGSATTAAVILCCIAMGAHASAITVGHMSLPACGAPLDGYCGSLPVPLNRHGGQAGMIGVGFEYYPHTGAGAAAGAILAEEGGPGYSTTGSRDGYLRLFAPLRGDHDILLIDKRGTGRSAAIDCPALQSDAGPVQADVAACARQLGPDAWLYRSADAADDVADVLTALDVAQVDYYGDSYGAWFGQVLAARHPGLLRTLVLDGAYPVFNDPSTSGIAYADTALDLVCQRSFSCAALGGSAGQRFIELLATLRAEPVTGAAPDQNGTPRTVTADPASLFAVAAGAGNAPTTWRNLDAAGRALLGSGDALPLLRLIAEAQGSAGGGNVNSFSVGLSDAVQCTDFPTRFDFGATRDGRQAQVLAFLDDLRRQHADAFAPFTVDDAANDGLDVEGYRGCVSWPAPPPGIAPAQPLPPGTRLPPLPTLVLSGDLDTVTSPLEGRATAALFPNASFLTVRNTGHETAIADEGVLVSPAGEDLAHCVGPIVRAFMATGGHLGETSCADAIRPIRTVASFARAWTQVMPARPAAGNEVGRDGLALAAAVVQTIGDVVSEFPVSQYGSGAGLRGGSFSIAPTPTGYRFDLHGVRWTQDLAADGTIDWNQVTDTIEAHVQPTATGHAGTLTVTWSDGQPNATATISGELDGDKLAATLGAP